MIETASALYRGPSLPGDDADLQTVLAAWHAATLRLEQTHETLQAEVRRLTRELEAKNRSGGRTAWQISVRWRRTWPTRCATAWSPFRST